MSTNKTSKWTDKIVSTKDLILDPLNPRIDVERSASQKDIRDALLRTEEVIDLAHEIISSRGNMAGERIIVTEEAGGLVVLEGNRRTCACQLINNPKLIPSEYKGRFPSTDDTEILERLQALSVDVAPSRAEAEPVITRRHTKTGIKKWSIEAKTRRLNRFIQDGLSIDQIMELVDLPKSDVQRALRDHSLIQKIKNLSNWDAKERKAINGEKVKWNPITRFFSLKGAKAPFGFKFEENGELASSLDSKQLDQLLTTMFRPFLISNDSGKMRFTTRTTPQEVYSYVAKTDSDFKTFISSKATIPPKQSAKPTSSKNASKPSAKVDKFFESLVCSESDDRLVRLATEISTINYKSFPIAATFLVRALVEASLTYAIKKAKLTGELQKSYNKDKNRKEWRDPGLEAILKFCIQNHEKLFAGNVKRALEQWKHLSKDWTDLIVHGKYVSPNINKLEHSADLVRAIIQSILSGEGPEE